MVPPPELLLDADPGMDDGDVVAVVGKLLVVADVDGAASSWYS